MGPEVETPKRLPLTEDEPTTLVEVFERIARVHERCDTLNYKRDGRWVALSSDEMLARVRRIAAGLHSLGVWHGDRVAILSESRAEWTLTDAGCMFAGAIDVPVYPTLTAAQVRYILKDSGARLLLIANHDQFLRMKETLSECSAVEHVVFFDEKGVQKTEGLTLAQLEERGQRLEQEQPGLVDRLAHETRPDELATIIYTSGTTGEPKGVML